MTAKTLTLRVSDLEESEGRAARRIYPSDAVLKGMKCLAGDPFVLLAASAEEDTATANSYAVGTAWPLFELEAEGSATCRSY